MSSSLKTLISKLNDTCRKAAEKAASLCMARGHYEVDLEHLFLVLLDEPRSDFSVLVRHFEVSPTQLRSDLEKELARFKEGNTRTPVFSAHLPDLLEQAWLIASLTAHTARIRSGHLLLSLLTAPNLSQLAARGSPLFARFNREELKHRLDEITRGSVESQDVLRTADADAADGEPGGDDEPFRPGSSNTPALDQFTTCLTQRARQGLVDPVIGRDAEIRQMIDILMRRRQNNPILTGEAGVGKTAVVEGLALRMAQGDVPPALQGVELHTLDMGLLQAGASVKGEFENRLKNVIAEVKKSPHPIILFIDEAHTLIGAGGPAGQGDAANLLKPALARGELRTVAATTWGEYKKYFEKDAALARRFQVVKVEEPSEQLAAAMLRGMAPLMESHFQVRIVDHAITEAVRLSARYVSGRQLPDKAISVLDTACAKVALGLTATPAAIEDLTRTLERTDAELRALEREHATDGGPTARIEELRAERAVTESESLALNARWQEELTLVRGIVALRARIDACKGAAPDAAANEDAAQLAVELQRQLSALAVLQGEAPMVSMQVDGHVVAGIVAAWTGIPLGKMIKDEIKAVLQLKPSLEARVVGQSHALEAVAQRVRTARAGLEDPDKPRGVFLFVGPSGVGKTETALALADVLYGGERNLISINMSEYQEAHSVSGLKGSPPGYVGYGEGGVLTEAVRRKPYSVLLLDEVEKAHPDVLELFFQVFDKGVLDDSEGRQVDFRNTLIILTSNAGSATLMQACLNKSVDERPDAAALTELLRPTLYKTFKPAFIGRMQVVPFYPLDDEVLESIIRLKLDRIAERVGAQHKAKLVYDDSLVDAVLARCTEVDTGARNVDHILSGTLLPEMAEQLLARMAKGKPLQRIKVAASAQGQFSYQVR
ncbi:MAG: ATPase [Pseudomonadota bacterium]|jgi:type VI secretion system protein VasG